MRKGNTVQAWDWQKFAIGQTSATWQGTFFSVKSLTSYHRTQRTTDAVLKVYFGNDGVEIKRTYLEGLQFPAAVEPDSLREKMFDDGVQSPQARIKTGCNRGKVRHGCRDQRHWKQPHSRANRAWPRAIQPGPKARTVLQPKRNRPTPSSRVQDRPRP